MSLSDHPLPLDAETKAIEAPHRHKDELRLWLRLLTCTNLVEADVRRRLREQFDMTLPRFDLMAQLERAPDGMTLSEVSKRMMVSNGNVTGLVDRLVENGSLERIAHPTDRRVQVIRLTAAGRKQFAAMAKAHETWIGQMVDGLKAREVEDLLKSWGRLKASVSSVIAPAKR